MWHSGQVVGIADQIAFIVGRCADPRWADSWDVTWVDCIGQRVTLPYDDLALRNNGNVPGHDRVAVPGVERRCRLPVAPTLCWYRHPETGQRCNGAHPIDTHVLA